jgi:hypothetical protein
VAVSGLFINAGDQRQLAAGDVVFVEGDPGTEMYGVVDGEIELTVDGRTIAKLGPGEVFGEMALVDSSDRMATAKATGPSASAIPDRPAAFVRPPFEPPEATARARERRRRSIPAGT